MYIKPKNKNKQIKKFNINIGNSGNELKGYIDYVQTLETTHFYDVLDFVVSISLYLVTNFID